MTSEMLLGPLNPAWIIVLGGLFAAIIPSRIARNVFLLALPFVGLALLWTTELGSYSQISFMGYELVPTKLDELSRIFSTIFLIAIVVCVIYAWHVEDVLQHSAGMLYAGAAVGAVLAGDLISLFVYWELTAIASVFLIWARRTERSFHVGMRYLTIHVSSGVFLLAGAIIFNQQHGSIEFTNFKITSFADLDLATGLILLAFGIKAAFPLLHNWLQDAYPEATVTGTVFLSAFTTKLAVYALARGFAGLDILIPIGATMVAFPIFYAVIENDFRRVLAYSLNSQLGYMVVAVGIGSELAINGAAAHAFSHTLYKVLLFMGMGAVLYRAGTAKASELGGLYKSMPLTTVFTSIGAAAISAFPLFSGFVSKSLILSAVAVEGHWFVWTVLLFASAGALHYCGLKVPFFAFFSRDSGLRPKEAPINMLVAMAIASVFCVGLGVYPTFLYEMLPYSVDYEPYTPGHIITQTQLLMFSALAFAVLLKYGIYPSQRGSTNLDTDWIYRRGGKTIAIYLRNTGFSLFDAMIGTLKYWGNKALVLVESLGSFNGLMARTTAVGNTGLLISCLLMLVLLLSYI